MFFEKAREKDDKPFLWAKRDGGYRPRSWRQIADQVRALAVGLRALGVVPGDRVVLVSENRPEWVIADLAIMSAGAISVPTYTTNTTRDHRHILTDSGAKAAIVSTAALAARLLPATAEAAKLRFVVAMAPVEAGAFGVPIHGWDDVLARGESGAEEIDAIVRGLGRGDVACLIYTSGTGGNPKGVMQRHESILHNCMGASEVLLQVGLGDDVFLSFLPLSHAYEHTGGLYWPISIGAQIYYAESLDTLSTNLLEARPTLMVSVPRLYEVMHRRIQNTLERQGGLKAKLFAMAVAFGRREYERPGSLNPFERVLNRLLDRLVRRKVAARFGGRLKGMMSGGAPLNPEVGIFFTALGVRLLQGYGQTEASPVISCNEPNHVRLHTVGRPFKDVEVRIADDGEILVRGPLVMSGYWNDEVSSNEVLRDGWLHTGDVGRIEADGCLQITDRKKDIIVLSGGDNLSPQRIEGLLTLQPEIAQAMVYGDRHAYVVALLVPDEGFVEGWARAHGHAPELAELAGDDAFNKAMAAALERANPDLASTERVKRCIVAAEPFTVDNELMTPTLKVRRHKVLEIYGAALEALY